MKDNHTMLRFGRILLLSWLVTGKAESLEQTKANTFGTNEHRVLGWLDNEVEKNKEEVESNGFILPQLKPLPKPKPPVKPKPPKPKPLIRQKTNSWHHPGWVGSYSYEKNTWDDENWSDKSNNKKWGNKWNAKNKWNTKWKNKSNNDDSESSSSSDTRSRSKDSEDSSSGDSSSGDSSSNDTSSNDGASADGGSDDGTTNNDGSSQGGDGSSQNNDSTCICTIFTDETCGNCIKSEGECPSDSFSCIDQCCEVKECQCVYYDSDVCSQCAAGNKCPDSDCAAVCCDSGYIEARDSYGSNDDIETLYRTTTTTTVDGNATIFAADSGTNAYIILGCTLLTVAVAFVIVWRVASHDEDEDEQIEKSVKRKKKRVKRKALADEDFHGDHTFASHDALDPVDCSNMDNNSFNNDYEVFDDSRNKQKGDIDELESVTDKDAFDKIKENDVESQENQWPNLKQDADGDAFDIMIAKIEDDAQNDEDPGADDDISWHDDGERKDDCDCDRSNKNLISVSGSMPDEKQHQTSRSVTFLDMDPLLDQQKSLADNISSDDEEEEYHQSRPSFDDCLVDEQQNMCVIDGCTNADYEEDHLQIRTSQDETAENQMLVTPYEFYPYETAQDTIQEEDFLEKDDVYERQRMMRANNEIDS